MIGPFKELAGLDRTVHEPARLAILTALDACSSADFLFLQRLTGLTKGNLSGHLAKLEQAGLIRIGKGYRGKVPYTSVELTDAGHIAVTQHWERLEQLQQAAREWRPDKNASGSAFNVASV